MKKIFYLLTALCFVTAVVAGEPSSGITAMRKSAEAFRKSVEAVKTLTVDKPVKITVTPTIAGTSIISFERSGFKIVEEGVNKVIVWPTLPGTTVKDFSNPSYKVSKNSKGETVIDSCIAGTKIKDFQQPSMIIKVAE